MIENELIQSVKEQAHVDVPDEMIRKFLESMEEVRIRPRQRLIDYGRVNSDIYCVKEGIIRIFHVEEAREITFGFATSGTIFLSPHSYYMNGPAFLMAETCKAEAVVLRMGKTAFDSMLAEYPGFAHFMFSVAMGQFDACERKLYLINGSARDRYVAVMKNRPEIIEAVPGNIIASYLGVTPQYLCNLKRELASGLL